MKKNKKLLIGLSIGVAVLIAVLVVVLLIPSQNNEIKVDDNNTILLYDKKELSPEEISIKNEGGEYQLLGFEYEQPEVSTEASDESPAASEIPAADEESETDSRIMVYTMQDHGNETLSLTMTNSLVEECRYMAASKLIDKSGSRYEEYGLDQPRAEAKIVFSDNSKVHLRLGKDAPDNMGVYLLYNDDRNVYLVPSNMVEMFFVHKLQMFDNQITDSIGERSVTELSISGTGYEQELEAVKNDTNATAGNYVMSKPYRASCNTFKVKTVGNSLFGMKADEIAAVGVDESGLSEYGLDKPYEKVTVKLTDGSSVTVLAGKKDTDGKCYITSSAKTTVFRIATEELTWYDADKNDLMTDEVLLPDQNCIETIKVRENGLDYTFNIEREYKYSDNYTDNIIAAVKFSGVKLNIQYAVDYINNISGVLRQKEAPASLDGCTEILSVRYGYIKDNKLEDEIKLYRTSDKKMIAVLNGNIECYTDAEYAEKLLGQADLLSRNKEIEKLYKTDE